MQRKSIFFEILAVIVVLGFACPAAFSQTFYVGDADNFPTSYSIDRVDPNGIHVFATLAAEDGERDGLDFDNSGNLFVARGPAGAIDKITPDGTVSQFAGVGDPNSYTNLTIDGSGTIYASDLLLDRVYKIGPGGSISTLAALPKNFGPDAGPMEIFMSSKALLTLAAKTSIE